jgi:hypothetical protein
MTEESGFTEPDTGATLFPELRPAAEVELTPRQVLELTVRFAAAGCPLSEEAFAAIFDAAEAYRVQGLRELAAELRAEGERQPYARRGLEFAAVMAEEKAATP